MSHRDLSDILISFSGGIRLTVRAKPGVTRKAVLKLVDIGDEKRAFEISVAAPAQDGKANEAICAVLADWLGVSKRAVSVKTGATAKIKIVEVCGKPDALTTQLTALIN